MDFDAALDAYGAAAEANAATVLVGAGLSRGAGYPSWATLLEPFYAEFGLADDYHDLPRLAQFVINADGGDRTRLIDHVVAQLNAVDAAPTINHRLLAELPIPEFWTTNYDPLAETSADDATVIETDDDFVRQPGGSRRVNKMHGSIRPGHTEPVGGPDALVISSDDYDHYATRHPRAWRLLQAQFLTKSFLFLGFSMTDPNFDAVFRLVRTATPDHYMSHYALLPAPTGADRRRFAAITVDLERSGIHVIEIDDFDQITDFLTRLVARTRPLRLYIAGSPPATGADGTTLDASGNYPAADELPAGLADLATRLGNRLASAGIRVATGSALGAACGYGLLDALDDYDPDRMWLLRRRRDADITAPRRRQGTIKFIGTDPNELRDQAFQDVRSTIVLGGGHGTAQEVALARERGMGVVPLALSGGTALDLWTDMGNQLVNHTLGGRPIDATTFEQLNDTNQDVALDAAVSLITQALFLPDASTPVINGRQANPATPPA